MSSHGQPPMVVPPYSPPAPSPSPPHTLDYDAEMHQERDLRGYLHILLKRKWWIIGTFLSIFLTAALYTFIRTPIFRTTATLQITQDNPGSQVTADDKFAKLTGG